MYDLITEILVLFILIPNTVLDYKYHQINLYIVAGAAGLWLLISCLFGWLSLAYAAGGGCIGLLLLAVSLISRGGIGAGDGILVCSTGIILGAEQNFALLTGAVVMCACVSLILVLFKKVDRKHTLPFVPFLLLSDIWRLFSLNLSDDSMTTNLKKGSFTVEASILLPFIFLVIFSFVCLCLYLHDRSVLSACASEIAGKASLQKYETTDHLEAWALQEAEELVEGRLFILGDVETTATVTTSEVTITYSGSSSLLHGISTTEQESSIIENPVEGIKSTLSLSDIIEDTADALSDNASD